MLIRIHFTFIRTAQPPKYPSPVNESYAIEATTGLHYSAYFLNMPIQLNHNDSFDWHDPAAITALWAAAPAEAGECKTRAAGALAEGTAELTFATAAGDVGCRIQLADPAWAKFTAAVDRFVASFELATGRPRTAYTLPQATR